MTGAPLVGRGAELAALTAALEAAASGTGSVQVVAGESGVGKTRLTQAAQAAAARRGFACAVGRAFPVESGTPYALFADAFVPMLRALAPGELQVLSRGAVEELAALFPVLGAEGAATRLADGPGLKPRLHDAFRQLLQRLAQRTPTLVVLENLQWADPSSFELLHFVGRAAAAHRLVLLCTYNEVQAETNPMLRETERSLRSLGLLERHLLPPLTRDQTGELLEAQFGVAAAPVAAFLDRLHERTRGNPFFIEETLKALVAAGRLRQVDGRWVGWEVDPLELPHSIRDALRARYDRLSPVAQDVVIAASVVGAEVPHALLERIVPGGRAALLAAVEDLLRERVLEEVDGSDGLRYAFTHPLLQEVLYQQLSRARVRELHGLVAEALEALHGDAALQHADALAVHFLRAGAAAHSGRACRYLTAAGEQALARGAAREAAESLGAALAIAERGDDEALAERLTDLLARARHRLGDYAEATRLWAGALARAVPLGDHARVARLERQLGVAALRRGDAADALRHHDRGVEAAVRAADPALEASLRLARSTALLEVGRGDDAERDLRIALGVAERRGDPAWLSRVHHALQLLAIWRGPSADARLHGEQALALARRAGARHAEWAAHWALAVQAGLTGDSAGTLAALTAAKALAAELRSPLLRLWSAEVEIEYLSGVGEWGEALALAERTIVDARAFGQRALVPRLQVWAALITLGRGDMAAGEALVEEAWRDSGADRAARGEPVSLHLAVPAHVARAYLHLYRAEYAPALAVAEAGLALADRTGYTAWAMHRLLPVAAEASLWVRDFDRAMRHGQRLRATAAQLGHPLALAWADACDALKKMLADDKAGAVEQLRHAAEALDAIPFVEHGARLRRKLVDALVAAGDRDGAARECQRIHGVFSRLGARAALEELERAMRALRIPVPKPPRQGAELTARELEIARLVAGRLTNGEIGARLGISTRTVSTHLSNMFEKLGLDGRGALTDWVRARHPA